MEHNDARFGRIRHNCGGCSGGGLHQGRRLEHAQCATSDSTTGAVEHEASQGSMLQGLLYAHHYTANIRPQLVDILTAS